MVGSTVGGFAGLLVGSLTEGGLLGGGEPAEGTFEAILVEDIDTTPIDENMPLN